jgi:hypothetical protein
MFNFKQLNNVFGWLVFAIATITYALTMETTASYWDCGEFISAAYKLQVVHPPGAPMFLLLERLFAMLAGSNISNVAFFTNLGSGLSSSFTILFLFWSITLLASKLVDENKDNYSLTSKILIIGSGVVGALAYTFSDTFWFSAVETEVYAMSSLCTAVVFWAILKWENIADDKHADRWIVLISLIVGLSIGVHLLNLLAIPAIAFVYYFNDDYVGGEVEFKNYVGSPYKPNAGDLLIFPSSPEYLHRVLPIESGTKNNAISFAK